MTALRRHCKKRGKSIAESQSRHMYNRQHMYSKHLENEAVELNKLSDPDQPVISDDDQLLTLRASTRVQYERVWGRFDDLAEEDRTWDKVNNMLQTYEYEHYKNKSSGVKSFITSTKELCRLYRSGNCYKSQADCRYSHAGGAKLARYNYNAFRPSSKRLWCWWWSEPPGGWSCHRGLLLLLRRPVRLLPSTWTSQTSVFQASK